MHAVGIFHGWNSKGKRQKAKKANRRNEGATSWATATRTSRSATDPKMQWTWVYSNLRKAQFFTLTKLSGKEMQR